MLTCSTVNGNMFICASSARAVTDEAFSLGVSSKFSTNADSRVRLSELKFQGLLNRNGSRINKTESNAIAISVFSSVKITGGGAATVSVASLLVAVPNEFGTMQRNLAVISQRRRG